MKQLRIVGFLLVMGGTTSCTVIVGDSHYIQPPPVVKCKNGKTLSPPGPPNIPEGMMGNTDYVLKTLADTVAAQKKFIDEILDSDCK